MIFKHVHLDTSLDVFFYCSSSFEIRIYYVDTICRVDIQDYQVRQDYYSSLHAQAYL